MSSSGDHATANDAAAPSVTVGKGIVPVWGAPATTPSTEHPQRAPLPRFYSLSDLLYGSSSSNAEGNDCDVENTPQHAENNVSSSSTPFRGLCMVCLEVKMHNLVVVRFGRGEACAMWLCFACCSMVEYRFAQVWAPFQFIESCIGI